jgi:hypothetical protein
VARLLLTVMAPDGVGSPFNVASLAMLMLPALDALPVHHHPPRRSTEPCAVLEHGIYVSNSGDRPIVRYNHVFNNRANGIHLNGDIDTGNTDLPGVDGIITGARIEETSSTATAAAAGPALTAMGWSTPLSSTIFSTTITPAASHSTESMEALPPRMG